MFYMKKLKAILIGTTVSSVVCAILLALTAFILGKSGLLPKGVIPVITTAIGGVAVFSGALAASVYARENGILLGLANGFIYALIIATVSVLVLNNNFNLASVGKLATLLLSGAIGGILGVNRKNTVKF